MVIRPIGGYEFFDLFNPHPAFFAEFFLQSCSEGLKIRFPYSDQCKLL